MPELFINQAVEQFIQREFPIAPTKILFVGENYPGTDCSTYIYRSIMKGVGAIGPNPFLNHFFGSIGIPLKNKNGVELNERERLMIFLAKGYRMIDALPNHVPPVYPIQRNRLNTLIKKIKAMNPEKIIFLGNRTESIIRSIEAHADGKFVIERLISKPNLNSKMRAFPYPAPPANPHHFLKYWQLLISLKKINTK
jgi:hypothetical protein